MTAAPTAVMASPADAVALAEVHQLSFAEPWDADVLSYLLSLPSSLALLERAEGGIAGFVLCRLAADESEVLTCAVAPAQRRHGIGRRLLTAALDEIRRRGVQRVFLEVAEDAPAACALYERCGFHPVGRRRRYYARPPGGKVDAMIMRCDL